MVILIGGVGCTGKTKLAHELMVDYRIPYFCLDHLMMGLYRSDPRCGFTPEDDGDSIGAAMWPIVREIIKTNIENGHSLTLEGFQIAPGNLAAFEGVYRENIVPLFLCFSPDYIERNYGLIKRNRNAVENRSDEIEPIGSMVHANLAVAAECRKFGIEPNVISGDYDEEMARIKERLRRRLADLAVFGGPATQ